MWGLSHSLVGPFPHRFTFQGVSGQLLFLLRHPGIATLGRIEPQRSDLGLAYFMSRSIASSDAHAAGHEISQLIPSYSRLPSGAP